MRVLLPISAFIVLAPLAAGCASASAKTKPVEMPPLSVPAPPPRVIEAAPMPEPTPEPVADLPPAPAKPNRPAARENREPAKPETKPPETPAPEAQQQPAPVPQPPTQLRTPATANDTEAENAIRGAIDRGRNLLASVNFGMLSNERKKAYNDAKMFLDQAESEMKKGNYMFAQGVAAKGETLAHDLAGR